MNISLSTIDNLFAGSTGVNLSLPKPLSAGNSNRFSTTPFDNTHPHNISEPTTTDNVLTNTQTESVNRLPENFGDTLRKAMLTKTPGKNSESTKLAEQPDVVQLWLAQYSQNIEQGKEGIATIVEPMAGYKLAQMLAEVKANSCTPPGKDGTILLSGNLIGFKTASLDISEGLSTAGVQFGEGKDANNITNKMLLASKGNNGQYSGLDNIAINFDSKMTAAGEKITTVYPLDTSISQKTSISTDKEFMPEAPVNADSKIISADEKSAMQDKTTIPDGQRMLLLNVNHSAVQSKFPLSQQEILVGMDKLIASNNAFYHQSPHHDLSELSESLMAGGKRQGLTSSDLLRRSGCVGLLRPDECDSTVSNPAIQKLNIKELQILHSQAKDTSRSATDNSSDSDFEQIFAPNSPSIEQPSVLEQSSLLPGSGKGPNNSSAPVSISQQILESIQNSLPGESGNQQITVHLHPPELGRVCIKFQEHQDEIIGLLEVNKAQTKREIEQALPQIIRNLIDCGIPLKRLDVVLTNQIQQQVFNEQSLQNGSFQQHSFTENSDSNNSGAPGNNELLSNDTSYYGNPEPQIQIADNYINMLI